MERTVREVVESEGQAWTRRLVSRGLDAAAAQRLVIATVAEVCLASEAGSLGEPRPTPLARRLAPRLGLSRRRVAVCLAELLPFVREVLVRGPGSARTGAAARGSRSGAEIPADTQSGD